MQCNNALFGSMIMIMIMIMIMEMPFPNQLSKYDASKNNNCHLTAPDRFVRKHTKPDLIT